MLCNRLEDIVLTDLQYLIDNEVCEGKEIEYKSELHIETGDERREFLADVSSFANANGGDLIFGIVEDNDTKLPTSISGIQMKNEDEIIRQIENMLRDSIQPRIPDIRFKMMPVNDNKYVLIIRVAPSFITPHRVTYKGWDKFLTRNSKGKYQMDVNELRTAFNMTQEFSKQIEDYKLNRIAEIGANRYRILQDEYPIFVIQLLPISAFQRNNFYSINEIYSTMNSVESSSFNIANNKQITVDGVIINDVYRQAFNNLNRTAYAHYKTNGIIEKATTLFFNPNFESTNISPSKKLKLIYRSDLVEKTIATIEEMLKFYKLIEMNTPIIVSCAIINGNGFTIPNNEWLDTCGGIDRDILLIPDVLIDNLFVDASKCMQPVFDSIWNACGYMCCPAYNDNGEFIGIK